MQQDAVFLILVCNSQDNLAEEVDTKGVLLIALPTGCITIIVLKFLKEETLFFLKVDNQALLIENY